MHVSSTKRTLELTKNEMRPTTAGISDGVDLAGLAHTVEHADGRRQRVRDLLHRRGPGLLQVVAAHVDRVPLRHRAHRVGDGVDGEPEARSRGEDVGPPAEILLHDVVLRRARQRARRDTEILRVGHVEAEQPRRGGVDRHRRVHRRHRDLVEQLVHVSEMRHGHTDLADLACRLDGVGVVAGLRRQVEGDRQPGLTLGQVGPVELVRGAGGRVARVRPHHPGRVRHSGHTSSCSRHGLRRPLRHGRVVLATDLRPAAGSAPTILPAFFGSPSPPRSAPPCVRRIHDRT